MARPRLLTVAEVAEWLRVHPETVRELLRARRLPGVRLGGRKAGWRISERDLAAYLARRSTAPLATRTGGHTGAELPDGASPAAGGAADEAPARPSLTP